VLLIFPLMIVAVIACGSESDSVASGGVDSSGGSGSADVVTDIEGHEDDADAHAEETALAVHDEEPHGDSIAADHEELASEADSHSHAAAGVVDPDAPVIHIFGTEFGYETHTTGVEAGHPFTIMFHNEGLVEHDITFEGLEDMGGIHLQPGEDGKATFTISEVGEYSYYCTVPGHHEAGMASALAVMASSEGGHDDDDGHHDAEVDTSHDDSDGHHDEDVAGA
jgi:plastocyanin